ncbi:DUF3105 domain-containing protein [Luteipulveratus mongoliensis]|uniref:DUF3105 domain-containing protein n=1 Tax=Luteipulveratus mongoliensis TaxID=571913 RepID=A0A0K1JGX2_9MICO|nr:DUF3105 domain-containing protein [Luteipulveratus mongoliensis]AKU15835.1 hypothetical protein VV02_08180 [Luteipulveratus mongoliensis]
MADDNESTTDEVSSVRGDARAKLASMQKKQSREQRRGGLLIGAIVGLVVIALVGGGAFLIKRDKDDNNTAGADVGVVKSYSKLTFNHVETKVKYPQNPPVGGDHNPAWANCGIYDKVIPNEHAVHSMEHGAVWITYKPGALSTVDLALLKGKAQQDYMLMSQDKTQSTPIVLSAWGKQLHVTSAKDTKIDKFIKDFLQGPQTREKGASCSGAYDPNTGQTG